MDEINKEVIYPLPATIENTIKILEQMQKCVFKIENLNGKGTGFFCYITYQNKKMPVMITTNHLINEKVIKESNIFRATLNDDKEKKHIDINYNRKIYTNIKYDTTIIEIKPEKDKVYHFLELDKYIFNEEINFFNESIYILQYQKYGKERKSSVSYGITKKIEDNYNLKYFCHVESGSLGSPILNLLNNKLIGIHTESNNYKLNKGTLLKYPINEYLNDFNLINKNEKETINEIETIKKKKKNKNKSEINMLLKIEKEDINNNIYFLDNTSLHDKLKELKESTVDLYINNIKYKYKKYFKPEKEGIYYIKLVFKIDIKDCSYMFCKCNKITNLDLSLFISKNINNMRYMFCDCNNLIYIDLSNINTQKVTDMSLMFYNCSNLINIDLSSFDMSNVNDIYWMLFECNNLKTIKIKKDSYYKISDELDNFKNLKIIKI